MNSREILSVQDTASIFKVGATTGTVAWKAGLTAAFPLLVVAPDGTTIAVNSQTSTYGLTMYSDVDGTIPASFTGSGQAQAIASGGNRSLRNSVALHHVR